MSTARQHAGYNESYQTSFVKVVHSELHGRFRIGAAICPGQCLPYKSTAAFRYLKPVDASFMPKPPLITKKDTFCMTWHIFCLSFGWVLCELPVKNFYKLNLDRKNS
tara:strand:- start:54 stop:374 length:321 start_codon:yes stop_codon:yes gene_type:complete